MKPDISEFSFGYAVTEELIEGHLPPITAAPFFPSLLAEGQAGGGYDVGLMPNGIPLFLQFKLCDHMVRNTAMEAQAGALTAPFYRMHLRPAGQSDQHHMLLDLEAAGNEVYYVAPSFHTPSELNDKYMDRRTVQDSVFIPPSAIGPLPDNDPHQVSFQLPNQFWFFSEPKKIEHKVDSRAFGHRVAERIKREGTSFSSQSWSALAEKMVAIVREYLPKRGIKYRIDFPRFRREVSPLRQVAYLTRSYFDSELLIVKQS